MKKIIQMILQVSLFVGISFGSALANANLATDLTDGQHVLLMRHADAPGYGDPAGYKLDQCATQRNLDQKGREQSQRIGQWLTRQGITAAHVLSSAWCRCMETAKLLDKGAVTIAPALASFFDDMRLEKSQTKALEKLIKGQLATQPNKPLILVTHHVNIQAYTGKVVSVGDMVLVHVGKDGQHLSHTLYPSP